MRSAPSEYVEVVPAAGADRAGGYASKPGDGSDAPDSAVGAAADAVASSGARGALAFGGVILAITLVLAVAATRRRHVPNG